MAYQYINKGSISNGGEYDGSTDPTSGLAQDSLWAAYDKINDMFFEIYWTMSGGTIARVFTTQVVDLVGEAIYTLTTTLDEEPQSIMIEDSTGKLITGDLDVSYSMTTGVCVLSIYSTDSLAGVRIKIIY